MKHAKLKHLSLIATTLGISLATFTAVSAWGPERPTFTMENPATYPIFNSITNNPTIGDERDFVRVGEINTDVTDLGNEVEIVPGKQYLVYVYFHNNASATYNDAAHHNSGVALRAHMSTAFSKVLTANEKGTIAATITADNTDPASVWDEAYMTTKSDRVFLRYVAGSAKIYSDWKASGSVMPSTLFTNEGALIGLNGLNGVIPGCEEYHGVVTYILQAEELGGSINKSVSKDGTDFSESIILQPGEEATYQLTISNTGDIALTNAVVKDTLPDGLSLVPGSVTLRANASTTEEPLTDDIFAGGYDLGTIGTGNTVYIKYKVKAGTDFDCTGRELQNNATLTYDSNLATGDTKSDSTIITVKKQDGCEELTPPLDTCETNPALPECQEKNCKTNPEMEGCSALPNTGPLEIIMAIIVILGLCGGAFYLYRTHRTLRTVENDISGKDPKAHNQELETPTDSDSDSSQKPDHMV